MRGRGRVIAAVAGALATAACSAGSPALSGGPTAAPRVPKAPSSAPGATPAPVATHRTAPRRSRATATAASTPTLAGSPTTLRAATTPPRTSPTSTPKPTQKSTQSGPTACATSGKTFALTIVNQGISWQFSPQQVDIGCGTKVVVTNRSNADHTWTGGSWDSGNLAAGTGSYSYVFHYPGTFSFVCSYHANMTGKVVVSGA